MLSRCERLGDETSASEVLEMPFWCALGLPGPEDPARVLLVSIQLSLNVVFQISLVYIGHAIDGSLVFAIAVSVIPSASWECLIVARTLAKTVQPLRAISLRAGPFSNHSPFIGSSDLGAGGASSLYVVAGLHGNFSIREDLVDMSIEDNVVDSASGAHESIPVRLDIFECVMDDDSCVAVLRPDIAIAIVIEFLQRIHVNTPVTGLVQEFNGSNNIGLARVAVGEILDCCQRL